MAKDKSKSADLTPDLLKRPPGRPPGRPPSGKAMTGAERIKRLRDDRKAHGLCPCCGQPVPRSRPSGHQV